MRPPYRLARACYPVLTIGFMLKGKAISDNDFFIIINKMKNICHLTCLQIRGRECGELLLCLISFWMEVVPDR